MNPDGRLRRQQLAIGLISVALLADQLALLQLLATSQWHHFAYLVISVALLGFGAAGTLLSLARQWLLTRLERLLPLCLLGCALGLLLPLLAATFLFGQFDSYLLFVSFAEILKLLLVCLLLFLPFFCGALAIGLLFAAAPERIGSSYFANLLGSGLGCFVGLAGLELLFPEQLIPVCALLAWLAALPVLAVRRGAVGAAAAISVLILIAFLKPLPVQLSQYKDLRRTLDLPGAEILERRPGADGQVHLVQASQLRGGTAVSLNWRKELPRVQALFSNGDRVGGLDPHLVEESPDDASTLALPYALTTPQRVLILAAESGAAVAQAVRNGAKQVRAVAASRTLWQTLSASKVAQELLNHPRVDWRQSAPRTWLVRDRESYGLIILPTVGSFGGSSGLYALNEQPLLTREALQQAYRRLQPEGLLAVTVWFDYPLRKPLRLLATLAEALELEGGDSLQQLVAVRSWGTLTFCVKKSSFTVVELAGIRAFCARWGFDPLLLPGLTPAERQRHNRLQDAQLFVWFDQLLSPARQQLYADYPFRITPAVDDRPFFAQFLRWPFIADLIDLYGTRSMPFVELGLLVAALTTLVLLLLALALILLPLLRLPKGEGGLGRTLLYFSGLGLGYIWVELVLIHRFSFYLGQPVLALALVVGVLLIGSGCGSLLSGKLSAARPGRWSGVLVLLIVSYALLIPALEQVSLGWNLWLRALLGGFTLVPLALLMGLPFPLGLRRLAELTPAQVPWAWGVNGCLSVAGAAGATLIAVELGFQLMLLLAAGAYLLPLLAGVAIKPASSG